MNKNDPVTQRRRRSGAIAAICGSSAAASATLGHHATSHGPDVLVWQDIGAAVAVVLIVVALAACVISLRRCG